jgi:SPRY domain
MALPNDTHPFQLLGNDGNKYKIPYSLRFRSSAPASLSRTPTVTGSRTTWTFSFWIKRAKLDSGSASEVLSCAGPNHAGGADISYVGFDGDQFNVYMYPNGGPAAYQLKTSRVFRDVSEWYHIVAVLDTTNSTSSDRLRIYVNGVRETTFATASYPTQYYAGGYINYISYAHLICQEATRTRYPVDGYMAEVHFIDGQALDASYFGQTDSVTNQWVPKRYQGLEFTPYTATAAMISQSGLQGLTAATVVQDADTTDLAGAAFYTDTSAAGSYLQYDLGVGNALEFRKVRVITDKPSGQGAYAVYNIQYSDDGTNWTTAFTSLDITSNNSGYGSTDVIPTQAIWGSVGAHRYWRLYKTNSATGGDYHRRVTFYTAKMSYTPDYGANGYYLPFSNLSTQTFGNTITYSQNLENAAWTKERATAGPNRLMAPDGTPTADKLYEDTTASNTHRAYIQSGTLTNAVTYCYSVYAKAGERSAFALEAWNSSTAKYCYVNLATGTVISGSDTNATVTSVGNGWYRCSVTNVGTGSGGSTALYLMNSATAGAMVYNGDGSSGMYFWGAQIEATTAGVPGPYLSTNGSGTSTYYPVSANESKYNKDINSNYNNLASVAIQISSAPTTSTTTHDSYNDTPTFYNDGGNGRGNYCTLNPLTNSTVTISNANLTVGYTTYTNWVKATFGITSGKWYWETNHTTNNVTSWVVGLSLASASTSAEPITTSSWWYNGYDGSKYNGNSTSLAYGAAWTASDTIGVAFDADAGTLTYYKNNVSQGQAFSGLTNGPYFPSFGFESSATTWTTTVNFGQRPFAYTPPAGFKALNTYNLANPSLPLV